MKWKNWMALMILFVILLAAGLWRNIRSGILVGESFLYQKTDDYFVNGENEIRVRKENGGTIFEYTYAGETKSAELVWTLEKSEFQYDGYAQYAKITFDDGTVVEAEWEPDLQYLHDGGMPITWNEMISQVSVVIGDEELEPVKIGKTTWSNLFAQLDKGYTEKNGDTGLVFLGGFCYILGALGVLFPEKMYFLGKRWRYKNAELSADGILMEQLGAIVVMLLGALVMLRILPIN